MRFYFYTHFEGNAYMRPIRPKWAWAIYRRLLQKFYDDPVTEASCKIGMQTYLLTCYPLPKA